MFVYYCALDVRQIASLCVRNVRVKGEQGSVEYQDQENRDYSPFPPALEGRGTGDIRTCERFPIVPRNVLSGHVFGASGLLAISKGLVLEIQNPSSLRDHSENWVGSA